MTRLSCETNILKLDLHYRVLRRIFTLRYLLLLLFCSCHPGLRNAQTEISPTYFEGEVIYDIKLEDKKHGISFSQNARLIGIESTYLYKDGKYKAMTQGGMPIHQIYPGGDTLFTHLLSVDAILWTDVKENNDAILETKLDEDVEEVNGVMCSLLTLSLESGSLQYYFSKLYPANPVLFEQHKLNFWSFCTKETGALPLKIITDTKSNYCELTAKSILRRTISDDEFNIPPFQRIEMND